MTARSKKCPTPDKTAYPAYRAALRALIKMPTDRLECRAYRCRGGHWHLTSRTRR